MRTIRQALTLKLLLGFASLLALAGFTLFFLICDELVEQFDVGLRVKAMAIATVATQQNDRVEIDVSDRFMREFDAPEREPRIKGDVISGVPDGPGYFELWLTGGAPVARSESLARADLPRRFGPLDRPTFWNLVLPSGYAGRAVGLVFQPREPGSHRTGEEKADGRSAPANVVLVVASDRRDLDRAVATVALVFSGCGALLLAGTCLIVPRVLTRELAPLDALADQAARINAQTLATRFPTAQVPGELRPISDRLNDLLTRLEQSFERERQFSGDLAHELRTPIAELRSLAELALQWPESREADTDRECLAIALQMERIVARLLGLLRSERAQLSIVEGRIVLAPLLAEVWRPLARRAADKGLQVTWDLPGATTLPTDAVLMRSILGNLLENAVEHAPSSSRIRVVARTADGRFLLQFTNSAGTIAPDDLPHLFDRFWRGDLARSGSEHSGLGLSLARGFAHALGWDLDAVLEDEMLTFTLSGPATDQPAAESAALPRVRHQRQESRR